MDLELIGILWNIFCFMIGLIGNELNIAVKCLASGKKKISEFNQYKKDNSLAVWVARIVCTGLLCFWLFNGIPGFDRIEYFNMKQFNLNMWTLVVGYSSHSIFDRLVFLIIKLLKKA